MRAVRYGAERFENFHYLHRFFPLDTIVLMIRLSFLFAITALLLSGCVNKRGVSMRYYNSCEEYYDLQGYYHKDCDDNLVDFGTEK